MMMKLVGRQKVKAKAKAKVDSDSESEEEEEDIAQVVDPREQDRRSREVLDSNIWTTTVHKNLVRDNGGRDNGGYGMDYLPDSPSDDSPPAATVRDNAEIFSSAERAMVRHREQTDSQRRLFARERAILAAECDSSATTIVEEEQGIGRVGRCEELYEKTERSLPVLIAMAQGQYVRIANIKPTCYSGPGQVFDLEEDDLLKGFSQKGIVLPKLQHLKDEAARRASLFGIKPMPKSSTKTALLNWLKLHPVAEERDVSFLHDEAAKVYTLIRSQTAEAAEASKAVLANKNWTLEAHLRLYHCCIDDAARPFMLAKDKCMEGRLEVDGRNSDKRPPTWHEKIAELYNSKKEYKTLVLPELHCDFADARTLCFEDMPGGTITAASVKTRLGDARARMITIISKWELSGNGFGQREEDDDGFGHVAGGCGDDRGAFLNETLGEKSHHLYFWHLSDIMGVLKNVLCVLSSEVAADTDNIPGGFTQTQKKRGSPKTSDDEREEREDKKRFREGVRTSLKSIGDGMLRANVLHSMDALERTIETTRISIRAEEEKLQELEFMLLTCVPGDEDAKIAKLNVLIAHHGNRVANYEEELQVLMDKRQPL
jgi:hypothetical protein